jgi:hypothetical protein
VTCLLLAAASIAFAQHVSIGIKAGVPLTNLVGNNPGDSPFTTTFPTKMRRYAIGPVVDIRLLLGFSVEFGAMYKRFDQRSIAITTIGFTSNDETGLPITRTAGISAAGHSWEFPLAV